MLTQLLQEIQKGGTQNPASLARKLGVSPDLVQVMLEDLERRGLLIQVNPSTCDQSCKGCPMVDGCNSKTQSGRLWQFKANSRN